MAANEEARIAANKAAWRDEDRMAKDREDVAGVGTDPLRWWQTLTAEERKLWSDGYRQAELDYGIEEGDRL